MLVTRRGVLRIAAAGACAVFVSACRGPHGIISGAALEIRSYDSLAEAAEDADVVVRGTASVAKLAYVFHVEEEDDDLPIVGVWLPNPEIVVGGVEQRFRGELVVAFFGQSGSTKDKPLGSESVKELTNLLVGVDALYFLRWGGSAKLNPAKRQKNDEDYFGLVSEQACVSQGKDHLVNPLYGVDPPEETDKLAAEASGYSSLDQLVETLRSA